MFKECESETYVRQGTSTAPASATAIREMIKATDGTSFEDLRSLEQKLTFTATQEEFAARNLPFATAQQRSLGLITADGVYTNLALLLSDQCPYTLKVASFQDTTPLIFTDRKEFTGSLLAQLTAAYNYLDYHNKIHATITGLLRNDTRDYPPVAVREALLNAIIHRDYAYSDSTIISLYLDRLEFISLGGLVAGISREDILSGISACRNHKLAHIFYRLRLIEAYGTGLYKINYAYREAPQHAQLLLTPHTFKLVLPNLNYVPTEGAPFLIREVPPPSALTPTSPLSLIP